MKYALIVCVVFLAACSNSANEIYFPVVPEWFKDCKTASIRNENGSHMMVARCPNSTTATLSGGKVKHTTIVVDGVEYEKVEK